MRYATIPVSPPGDVTILDCSHRARLRCIAEQARAVAAAYQRQRDMIPRPITTTAAEDLDDDLRDLIDAASQLADDALDVVALIRRRDQRDQRDQRDGEHRR